MLQGYQQTASYTHGLNTIRWGCDYLVRCHTQPEQFVAVVGNLTADELYWGRPEDQTGGGREECCRCCVTVLWLLLALISAAYNPHGNHWGT